MPTYRLESGVPVRVLRSTCELKLVVDPPCPFDLVVASEDNTSLGRADGVLPQRDGMLVIRPVDEPITVSMRASATPVFPVGARVRAFLSFQTPKGMDHVQVQVQSLELSGLRGAVLFTLHPEDEQYRLEAVGLQPPSPLSLAAEASAFIVRKLHGGDTVDRAVTADLSVLVDDSPSMSSWWRDGSLGAVLESLAGVDHELGSRDSLDVALSSVGTWQPVRSEDLGGVLANSDPTGRRLELATITWPDRSHRLVISDSVPRPLPDDVAVLLMSEPSAASQLLAMGGQAKVVVLPCNSDGLASALADSSRKELEKFVTALLDVLRQLDDRKA